MRSFCLIVVGLALLFPDAAPAAESRPNILFVIADDWGWPHAGAYGCDWVQTPNFDRVAAEGVLFSNCFTSNPKCSPCRASILTGRNTWQLEEACCHFGLFPHKWPVYPELLEQAGYFVGYTGKGWGPGDYKAGGFDRNPAGPAFNKQRTQPPHRFMSNVDYAANFADFLSQRESERPFCFWLGTSEPHLAYEDGIGVRAGRDPAAVDVPSFLPDNDTVRRDLLDYAIELEWFDEHLGRAMKSLEEAGLLDETLVVVTSDHGMPYPRVKGQIYEMGFHLPLAVRWGGISKTGRTVDDFVNVRDFAPTFLELAEAEIPETVTGTSIIPLLASEKEGWIDSSTRNRMLIGKERHDIGRPHDHGYPVRAIRSPEFLYIHNYEPDRWPAGNPETGYRNCDDSPTKQAVLHSFDKFYRLCFGKRNREELYRITDDPDCVVNLADRAELRAMKEQLRDEMQSLLAAEGDPRMAGRGDVFESYEYVGRDNHSWANWERYKQPE